MHTEHAVVHDCSPTWGAIVGAVNCLAVFHNFVFTSNPSLYFLKFHLNSGKIPPYNNLSARHRLLNMFHKSLFTSTLKLQQSLGK